MVLVLAGVETAGVGEVVGGGDLLVPWDVKKDLILESLGCGRGLVPTVLLISGVTVNCGAFFAEVLEALWAFFFWADGMRMDPKISREIPLIWVFHATTVVKTQW